MNHRISWLAWAGRWVAAALVPVFAACSSEIIPAGTTNPPVLSPSGASSGESPRDGGEEAASGALQCVDTRCPAPYATCTGSPLCSIDLATDGANCGTCGNACPTLAPRLHAVNSCVARQCALACLADYADCDERADNGCEVLVGLATNSDYGDPKNCGGCGVDCGNDACYLKKCGCRVPVPDTCQDPDGKPFCTNLATDDFNCKTCGTVCPPCDLSVSRTFWKTQFVQATCLGSSCAFACDGYHLDCDKDLSLGCGKSNGCETESGDDHCGACDVVCHPPEVCADDGRGHPTCKPPLTCPPDYERCAGECVDLELDPKHCGACSIACDPSNPTTEVTCKRGVCVRECNPGWADCGGADDCETNILTDVKNCSACGVACEYGRGQPCVGGSCLTKPCSPDAGGGIQ